MVKATQINSAGNRRRSFLLAAGAVALVVVVVFVAMALDDDDSSTDAEEGPSVEEFTELLAEQIRAGQQALKDVGCYSGEIDGRFSPATEQAIREFQSAAGLEVDGVFGRALAELQSAQAAGEVVCT